MSSTWQPASTVPTGDGEWTRPGVYEVAPDVFRVPLPMPQDGLKAVNVYAIREPDGVTLIDSGWSVPEARELLVRALDELGYSTLDIKRFLVTHVHRDHYEQAQYFRAEFGTQVALGERERPTLDVINDDDYVPMSPQVEMLRSCGADGHAAHMERQFRGHVVDPMHKAYPDWWLTSGPVAIGPSRTLEVVPTPGHTDGHVVFHDESARLLFTGDHVLPTITPSIGFQTALSQNPLGDFMASLALVRSRPDAVLLPAHGAPALSVHARVDELVDHHLTRLDETLDQISRGCSTAFEVAERLTWTRRERSLEELDHFNQTLAIIETRWHLELLLAQERVAALTHDGVKHFSVR